MSFFESMTMLPEDPILGLAGAFRADPRHDKTNLGIGSYADSEGKPYIFETVKKAEQVVVDQNLNKEYGPIEGPAIFREELLKLIFGTENPRRSEMICLQSLGATGALRIGASILADVVKTIYIAEPTWPNHRLLFQRAGFQVETYPYYDEQKQELKFDALCMKIESMPKGSVILFQGPCHNPTGCDPSQEQWKQLSKLIKKQKIMPFFDIAYVGFGDGLIEDLFCVRQFAADGHELMVAFSFSKNMGLYGERIGAFAMVLNSSERAAILMSHAKQIVRTQYSNPPLYPARLVTAILTDPVLYKEWVAELKNVKGRIEAMRQAFAAGLMAKIKGRDFTYIERQRGIFSMCGISFDQTVRLRDQFGIYLPANGRVNVAGLTPYNLDHTINSIAAVLEK